MCVLNWGPADCLVNISATFWWVQIGANKRILRCTHSCSNQTLTITCLTQLTVSWVKSLSFATAKVAVLSTHTIVLFMYVGSSCLNCRSNKIALQYLALTATLASAIVSAIAVQSTVVAWQPEYQAIAPPFITTTSRCPDVDLALAGSITTTCKITRKGHTECWFSAFWFQKAEIWTYFWPSLDLDLVKVDL